MNFYNFNQRSQIQIEKKKVIGSPTLGGHLNISEIVKKLWWIVLNVKEIFTSDHESI